MAEPSADDNPVAEKDREWWAITWAERRLVIADTYGESHPPGTDLGTVAAFPADMRKGARVPEACVLVFRPEPKAKRPHWTYMTLGLSQPLAPHEDGVDQTTVESPRLSRTGVEVAFVTKDAKYWGPFALFQIARYVLDSKEPIRPGARLPFRFIRPSGPGADRDAILTALGMVPPNHTGVGDMASLLFWPALDRDGPFVTSTGRFDLLVGTAITGPEWDLAKATSSVHLLLLLVKMGNGQKTEALRKCLSLDPKAMAEWEKIKGLTRDQVLEALYGPA